MIVLWQADGPAVDRGVGIATGAVAVITFWFGLRWSRSRTPAPHSLRGLPMQIWAFPMILFALLLGTGVITTAEEPRQPRAARFITDGGLK